MPIPGLGTAIGLGTSLLGGLGASRAAGKAQARALEAQGRAVGIADRNASFIRGQYQQHRRIYGDVEADVYNFTKRLIADGGEKLKTQQLQRVRRNYGRAENFRKARLAQLGISPDSGIAIEQELAQFNQLAEQEAQIEYNAPLQALEIGQNFVAQGANRGNALLGALNTSTGTQVNALQNQSQLYQTQAENVASKSGNLLTQFSDLGGFGGFGELLGAGKSILGGS